jgi:pyruvate/2-oxoglutarate dehydrogenase complex dihydrolipoamide dehydrogenase (E3) component
MTPKKQPEPVAVESQTKRVSDVVWQALIAGLVTIVLASVSAISANYAASKVEQVRVDLKTSTDETTTKLDGIASIGEASHDLSNSFMLAMKKKLADTSRKLANMTKDPEDIARAEVEEAAYEAHRLTDERMRAEKAKK